VRWLSAPARTRSSPDRGGSELAYYLEALLFPADRAWPPSLVVYPQGMLAGPDRLVLLPLTNDARAQMGDEPRSERVLGFDELTEDIRRFASDLSAHGPVVYVHAEIHGGTGTQASVGWRGGTVDFAPVSTANNEADAGGRHVLRHDLSDGAINQALRYLGVRVVPPAIDEFDSVGLGTFRSTEDWKLPD
jgi:hypothetical protein